MLLGYSLTEADRYHEQPSLQAAQSSVQIDLRCLLFLHLPSHYIYPAVQQLCSADKWLFLKRKMAFFLRFLKGYAH